MSAEEIINVQSSVDRLERMKGFTKYSLLAYAFEKEVITKDEFRDWFRNSREFQWKDLA